MTSGPRVHAGSNSFSGNSPLDCKCFWDQIYLLSSAVSGTILYTFPPRYGCSGGPVFTSGQQLSTSLVRIPKRASRPEFWPRSYLKSKCMYAAPQAPRLLPHGNQFEVCFRLVYTCPIHTLAFIRELPLSPNSSFPRGTLMPKSLHSDSRVGKDIYTL